MAKCVRYDDRAGAGMEQRPEAETCEEAAVLTPATVQGGGGPWRELGDRLPGELGRWSRLEVRGPLCMRFSLWILSDLWGSPGQKIYRTAETSWAFPKKLHL